MFRAQLVTALGVLAHLAVAASGFCRCRPDDPCWPSTQAWDAFNATVDGRLIKTIPLGHVCHDPTYDEQACHDLRRRWTAPETHYETSHSIMAPVFANDSCSPWEEQDAPCEIGAYVQYAVNVSSPEHVTKTIQFVRANNIRLVIRNTGHDYLGKSSGPFSLALWTHHLATLSLLTCSDETYHGPAIKLSAGVQGADLLAFAAQHNLTALTGNCPSVGIAGGYIQGGGHSALSSKYGLAADQLLEMEIVDASGTLKTVSRQHADADLFWALSGGGAGTFAVVLSVTVRAYPDLPSATVSLTFEDRDDELAVGTFLEGVAVFLTMLPVIHAAGCATIFSFTRHAFQLTSLICYGLSPREALAVLHPFLTELEALHILYRYTTAAYARWSDGARAGWLGGGGTGYEVGTMQAATWLVPRAVVEDSAAAAAVVEAVLRVQELGGRVGMQTFSPSREVAAAMGDNAVFPGWREAAMLVWVVVDGDAARRVGKLREEQALLSTVLMPVVQAVAPGGGTYLNEADAVDGEWKRNSYGELYGRLMEVKRKYDPESLFYARHAVGSDAWVELLDGRLCRVVEGEAQVMEEL